MTRKKELFKGKKILQHTEHFIVKFNQTDALGIVWHGNYVDFFEDGREAFGRAYGISYKHLQDEGYATPIVKMYCEHKKPLRYADEAYIITTFIDDPAAKMLYHFQIFNAYNELVCIGETTQVFTDLNGNLQLNTPDFFENWKIKMGLK